MKFMHPIIRWLWLIPGLLFLADRDVSWAQTNTASSNTLAGAQSTNSLSYQPAITNTTSLPYPVEPLSLAPKPPPGRPGGEMTAAFRSVGGVRFSVPGTERVLKLPEKNVQKKSGDWVRTVELGVNTARGNSDILRYDAAVSLRREDERNLYWLKLGGRYGESDGVKDTDAAQGEGKYERGLNERWYASLNGELLRDRIADLSYRAMGNVSLGRHFIWTEQTVLNLELGPGYVRERKGGANDGFAAGRLANYFERLVNGNVRVWQRAEYVPNLEEISIFYAHLEVGVETLLLQQTSLKFTIQDRYDNNPAEGKRENDLLTLTSLNWIF